MIIKGYAVRLNHTLGHRSWKPGDLDLHGDQIPPYNVVFVRIKDCILYSKVEDQRVFYDPSNAAAVPVGYFGTFYGAGSWRHTTCRAIYIGGLFCLDYWTAPIYFVKDGKVYTGTIHRAQKPTTV